MIRAGHDDVSTNWVDILETIQTQLLGRDHSNEYFYSKINGASTLVITAGDSWTFGGGLGENRLNEIYGQQLATHYNADWINIGCPGWSNSYILLVCQHLLEYITKTNYNRIIVVLTLTENGRDATTPESHLYNYINCFQKTGTNNQFYEQVLLDSENRWLEQINSIILNSDNRFEFFVGQNFVWHDYLYAQLQNKGITLGDSNWIEVLADYQNLARPIRTNLVTGWIFNPECFGSVDSIVGIKNSAIYKSWALPYINRATLVNEWLDSSPMNYKKHSKHPVKEGHTIWANYIINQLKGTV
jgi:hypothetical protein